MATTVFVAGAFKMLGASDETALTSAVFVEVASTLALMGYAYQHTGGTVHQTPMDSETIKRLSIFGFLILLIMNKRR